MMTDDDTTGLSDLSNREILRIMMQEIADVYRDLTYRMDGFEHKVDVLSSEMQAMRKELKSDIRTLRLEVHQNHTAFMTNHDALKKRVTKVEMAA